MSLPQPVSSGNFHTMFLLENGDVYACGDGRYGQLGTGTTTDECYYRPAVNTLHCNVFTTRIPAHEPGSHVG
jgi:alpha-tubulin suppressor-like RCC1 family protein